MHFNNFHEAYIETLYETYHHPQFFNAPRGNHSREKLNHHLIIENPVERICYLASRKTNIVFNFAEVLWYLSADNSVDFISYYNKKMSQYSMNGKVLTGTAYGPKIFEFGNAKVNQWKQIKDLLTYEDVDSKRAFMQIFDATELMVPENIDVSCTVGLQFFVRENKLYMASFMRANDAFRGIVSDLFSFTLIQELMARELQLDLGTYFHNVGSIHVYQSDNEWTETVLQEAKSNVQNMKPQFQFPTMPLTDNWSAIETVLNYESLLRQDLVTLSCSDIEQLDVADYWKQVLYLFSLYQYIAYKRTIDFSLFRHLLPVYQHLMMNKWPSHFKTKIE
ncbi:thymidylate synthase [Bacillus sp. C1-1]|nr:thymidylate synthase [Bacillus sp. C1-1]